MSYAFSDADITAFRARHLRSLRDTCIVSRNSAVPVKGAPSKPNFQPVAPGDPVPCRLTDRGGPPQVQEQLVALQLQGIQAYVLILPVGTDIARNDRVVVTRVVNGNPVASDAMQVIGTDSASTWAIGLHALVQSVGATS
jgi:hypothetical protein